MQRIPAILASAALPGLGQYLKGQRTQGIIMLCMTCGILGTIALAVAGPAALQSSITVWIMSLIYLFVWFPAVIDAAGKPGSAASQTLSGDRAWYVVMMLLTVGPMALPLLWTSPRFSRRAKRAWTTFVIIVFISAMYLTLVWIPKIEAMMRSMGMW